MNPLKDFKTQFIEHLTFVPIKMGFCTEYLNLKHPDLGYIKEFSRGQYYTFGIADYTIPRDFKIKFSHDSVFLKFGLVNEGTTDFQMDGLPNDTFSPSSFIVLEDSVKGEQRWKKGTHFHGAEIIIGQSYFKEMLSPHFPDFSLENMLIKNHTYLFLPLKIVEIIQQLQSLALKNALSPLLLEAKIMECLALIFKEQNKDRHNAFKNQENHGSVTLRNNRTLHFSAADIEAIQKAHDLINGALTAPFTIKQLSKMVFLNEQKLKLGFQMYYHLNIGNYTQKARMTMAANLLSTTRLPIDAIAKEMGYANASNFAKAFKSVFEKTPLQYRHQVKNKEKKRAQL